MFGSTEVPFKLGATTVFARDHKAAFLQTAKGEDAEPEIAHFRARL
jgi:hypothetical protein